MTVKNNVKERLDDRIRPQYPVRTKVRSNTSEHSTLLLTGNDAKALCNYDDTAIRQNMGRTFWWLATEVMVFSGDAGKMCKGWGRK
jgi:hypothetical protein